MEDWEIEELIKEHNNDNNNIDKLVSFVEDKINTPYSDIYGPDYMIYGRYSLLITAVSYNQYDLAELFLDMGADINSQNPRGETSLYIVCTQEDKSIKLLLLLLNRGTNINEVIRYGATTALIGAIGSYRPDKIEIVKLLLEYGANPNKGDNNNNRPLQRASGLSDRKGITCIKLLLEYGANINGTNIVGATALFFACLVRNDKIIDFLLEYGANPFILNREGEYILNNNMLDDDVKEYVSIKINELHKLNVSYDMIEISKGIIEDHPLEELTDDLLESIYNEQMILPYDPEKTRLRMDEDIQDIRMSRFITDINKYGGKRKKTKKKYRKTIYHSL
jgi:ankyrin repeat protein